MLRGTLSDPLKGADFRSWRLGAGLPSGQAGGGRQGVIQHPSAAPGANGRELRRSRRAPMVCN